MARLTSEFWVSAYIRRCNGDGIAAVLRRRGAAEAGAIFVKVDRLDGTADLFGPAPQMDYGAEGTGERLFALILAGVMPLDVEEKMRRETRFDEDLWWVEIESRDGTHFLALAGNSPQ